MKKEFFIISESLEDYSKFLEYNEFITKDNFKNEEHRIIWEALQTSEGSFTQLYENLKSKGHGKLIGKCVQYANIEAQKKINER